MISEFGHVALLLALSLSVVQALVPLVGAWRSDARLMAVGSSTALGAFVFVAMAFAALTYAYVVSDFSVRNVWENSHSQKPLLFKFTGVWGNHEGSMLLWVGILTLFSALVAVFSTNLPAQLRANVLAIQGWIATTFLLFVTLTSNPFERLFPAPFEGRDLNPILQDVGLAIHPPLLYVGYVGFSVAFSFAIAALISGRIDAAWARWVRPWTLMAWLFLTLGIAMGSYWAYYELGWGGWWFWDPVENASFMPWLFGTALLHSAVVMEKRNALKIWTILLAILTFSMSLLGTFLVRSGVLTSVHTFASDPSRGVFILMILLLFIGGGLALFALRAGTLKQGGIFAPISREGALVLNNVLLTTAATTVLIGTLYPLALEALTGEKISVGPPYFNLTFGPLMLPLLLAMPFGPFLAWKRGDLKAVLQRFSWVLALAGIGLIVTFSIQTQTSIAAPFGIAVSVWLIFGALAEIIDRARFFRVPLKTAFSRLLGLPRSAWGTTLAHAGMGITLLGIVGVSVYEREAVAVKQPGDTIELSGYSITLEGIRPNSGPNYTEQVADLTVRKGGNVVAVLSPAKRLYQARNFPTTEAGIKTFGASQLYATLGDFDDNGGVVVRVYDKPLVLLIWIGALFMGAGGLVSLTDRRLRVGAPKRARSRSVAVPAE